MMNRWVALVLCIAGAGALAGGLAWHRLSRATPESDPLRYWMQKGAEAYAKMDSVPIRDTGAVRSAMAGATVEDAEGVLQRLPAALDPLRQTVVDFLTTRLTAASSADYVSWMESQGYRFKAPEEFEKRYGPLADQAEYAGVTSRDVPTLFHAMWAHPPSRNAAPDALCTGPAAMTIALGHTDKDHFTSQVPAGVLGEELWHGGAGGTCRFWMRPPVTRQELVARDGRAACAQVGVIACVPGSARRPMIVNLFFEPRESRWWIDGVSVTNHIGTNRVWTCTEY